MIDASTALKWVLIEQDADKALRVRDDYRNRVRALIAPDAFVLECAHTLTKKQKQGLVADSRMLWEEIMLDSPLYHPFLPLMDRAVAISIQCRHNVHDCLYVALAEQEGCELITSDQRMINNLARQFPFIVPLSSLP